jgi:hypothetical protein
MNYFFLTRIDTMEVNVDFSNFEMKFLKKFISKAILKNLALLRKYV